jgi:hypothetical protein
MRDQSDDDKMHRDTYLLARELGDVVTGKDPAIALGALGLLTVGTIRACWKPSTGANIGKAFLESLQKDLLP